MLKPCLACLALLASLPSLADRLPRRSSIPSPLSSGKGRSQAQVRELPLARRDWTNIIGVDNALRLPGAWNVDLGLARNLNFSERYRFQIHADLLNALNHTNFSGVDSNIRSANFGKFTATRGARVIQLNARFTF